jgi:hypothetical protein
MRKAAASTLTMLMLSPSTSISFARRTLPRKVMGVSSAVDKLSLEATGALFTGVTVTVTFAVAVPPLPSDTV